MSEMLYCAGCITGSGAVIEGPRDDARRRAGLSCSTGMFTAGTGKAGMQRSPDGSPTFSAQHEPTGSSRSSGDSASLPLP